jgi:hypothetical protein
MSLKKRGFSHIESIISFVLFIGFLIFAFIFLNPFQSNRTLDTSLNYAQREILKLTESEVEIYSVIIDRVSVGDMGLEIDRILNNVNSNVYMKDGSLIPSAIDSSDPKIIYFYHDGAKDFFNVMFSDIFLSDPYAPPNPTMLSSGEYNIASSEIKKIISERKLDDLVDAYNTDYDNLKSAMNFPKRVDFGFTIIFGNSDTITAEKNIPENIEVVSEEDRVEVVRKHTTPELDGEIVFADLIVKVW